MVSKESFYFVALDEDWRPLHRLDGQAEWRAVVDQLLRLESKWLIIEQLRTADVSPAPRGHDIRFSRTLSRRLRQMEVKLADHVIQGPSGRFSFREAGLL